MASKEKEERVNELTEINIKLDVFEGPLDLLLHLIQQMEIDIYDIPIATITEQYMNYIHTMKNTRASCCRRIPSDGCYIDGNQK